MTRLALTLLVAPFFAHAAPQSVGQETYRDQILPFLQNFCYECHGGGARQGGLALDSYASYDTLLADKKRWAKALQLIGSHVMPPAQKPQPLPEERRAVLEWIDEAVFYSDPERPDPGHPRLRRLNRAEFNNSVRDVFGIESRPADTFPPDDSGYGFDTIGEVLSLSPALLEKVLQAARQVVDEATSPKPVGQVGIERQGSQLLVFRGEPEKQKAAFILKDGETEVGVRADIRATAVYRVLINAASVRVADEPAKLEIRCDGERVATLDAEGVWKGTARTFKTDYALVHLPAGEHTISVRIANPGSGETGRRIAAIQAFKLRGPFNPVMPVTPAFLRDLVGEERSATTPRLALSGEDLQRGEGTSNLDTGAAWFSTNGYRQTPLVLTEGGRYRFRVKAGAQQAGSEPVRFELRVGDRRVGPFPVTAADQQPEWIECETDLDAGAQELQVWFVNEFKDERTEAERWLWIHEFTLDGPLRSEQTLGHKDVVDPLVRIARRLYRRPPDAGEVARLAALVRRAEKAGETPMGTLRLGLIALLSSPHFLYWNQPLPAGAPSRGTVEIDEFSLASRLSAFLWSSVPDERLLKLAERGGLRKQLRDEVARMLADPKARALSENFAGQWLELRDMALVARDPALYPGWSADLAADMRRESELVFDHILRENLPVLELLTADYTFVNERLAAHYGLAGVTGDEFRRVSLASTPRRGILTHGSILTFTSHPTRTSPVRRGKFVLEKILGITPPPAPSDVPPLEEPGAEGYALSTRRKLEAHRQNPTCASCHAFLDPPGFALEHYDAVGRWRDTDEGAPVDASGRLVTGETFRDFEDLRQQIVRDRADEVARSLVEQLFTYALGRGLEYSDKGAVREVLARARTREYRIQEMIFAICESVPFQKMRAAGIEAGR